MKIYEIQPGGAACSIKETTVLDGMQKKLNTYI